MEAGKKTLELYRSGSTLIALTMFSAMFSLYVAYPRAILSAHLVGITGGLLLIAVGTMLPHIKLGCFEDLMIVSLNFGNWLNVIGSWYSAFTGAVSRFRNYTKDHTSTVVASPLQNDIATGFDIVTALLILIGLGCVVGGLWWPCCQPKSQKQPTVKAASSPIKPPSSPTKSDAEERTPRSRTRTGTPRRRKL